MRSGAVITACLSAVLAVDLKPFDAARRFGSTHTGHQRDGPHPPPVRKQTTTSIFLNENTTKFAVDGVALPQINFDVGESYAGQLPIGTVGNSTDGRLFFWFFPTTAANQSKEIIIWLNGGPGCSSLTGLVEENGPFLWRPGTFEPVANPWSWHHLSNVVWIEQPIGTGFSTGTVTAQSEDDLAQQLMGFWKTFVDTFALHGYDIYITGESYAGAYCPFIASNMLDTNDQEYFDVKGMLIYDPLISDGTMDDVSIKNYVQYWRNLMPLNDSLVAQLEKITKDCGYDDYLAKYLTFPSSGQQPASCYTPGLNADCTDYLENCAAYELVYRAMAQVNPGFDVYHVAQLTPRPDSVLGSAIHSDPKAVSGRQIYFNRTDVKQAIHAPMGVDWEVCANVQVFDGGDSSAPSTHHALPNVIDRTRNVQISHATMDMVLLANRTLLGIQNMTWGRQLGFQCQPREPLFVPYHDTPDIRVASGSGVQGTWHSERGLTWALVGLASHMVPQSQAALAFRQLEVLLGRVDNLSSTKPFPMYTNAIQPDASEMGCGTATYGFQAAQPCTFNGAA